MIFIIFSAAFREQQVTKLKHKYNFFKFSKYFFGFLLKEQKSKTEFTFFLKF